MKQAVHQMDLNMSDPDDFDLVLLSSPPQMTCKRYLKMRAYGNHWRVEDEASRSENTFDSGVACFEANEMSTGSGKDYVGVLQDIFLLDYGGLKTPMIIFSCIWKRRHDNFRRDSYIRDEDGFLVVNFKVNTPKSVDPYVFPSQCSQVYFSDDDLRQPLSQWKVVLGKEARSRRKIEENDGIFMTTYVENAGSVPSSSFAIPPELPDLTGAIVLNDADNALALQSFEMQSRSNTTARPSSTKARTVSKRERNKN